ncbi:hypothetical protein FQN60_016819 [Etheostoma spectabile]|uniref:Uncharacterized protein n=1 Tax=Etheostoma spectabile TaxID=54343 RepID=A0A5J5CG56_9PERO|nr:hypothetical protein FQN60_016819 [Etheostoma spectabile]
MTSTGDKTRDPDVDQVVDSHSSLFGRLSESRSSRHGSGPSGRRTHPQGQSSALHSGLYYCLLQDSEGGPTLWPYQVHVGPRNQEPPRYRQRGAFRVRRDAGSGEERQAERVSDGQFAGAVAASVLLTFVLGFSAGALSRAHVLRCLGAVTRRLQSPRKRCRADTRDRGAEVTVTTLRPASGVRAFETTRDDDNETTMSSAASSPPVKPQRSFRQKRPEEPGETTAYLEGCDHGGDEKEEEEEEERKVEVAGRSLTETEDERECRGSYPSGEDGGSQTGKDEEKEGRDGTEERRDYCKTSTQRDKGLSTRVSPPPRRTSPSSMFVREN